MKNKFFLVLITLLSYGCATNPNPSYRLGQFTVASSNNVRNLHYSSKSQTSVQTKGEDCNLVGVKPNDSRLQRAMDKAIKNGHAKGIDGDLLVNVRIDQQIISKRTGIFGLPQYYNCIVVSGELVKITVK